MISIAGPTVLPGRPPYSVEDLFTFPDDGNRYELFNGSLLISPLPTILHQRVISRAMRVLDREVPRDLTPLMGVGVQASDRDFYIPDLVVVPEEAIKADEPVLSPGQVHLVGEVVGPDTQGRDRALKVLAYAVAGIPVYWRIEPDEEVLYVHELDGDTYGPPIAYGAGTGVTLSSPFPVSFDPADLVSKP
ncbi:Uma2 family endonuclease [Nonomuraea sp. NPDC004186]|uniref:Uma2 family endonuclease n=1 Tax=Nonomuraea sp. NPDC049625 TaxID=3155775 RepID=UPI0034427147